MKLTDGRKIFSSTKKKEKRAQMLPYAQKGLAMIYGPILDT